MHLSIPGHLIRVPAPMSAPETPVESKAQAAARLTAEVGAVKRLRLAALATPAAARACMALRAWQSARLARTYADLLASPRYRSAALFFLNDLYGPKDFSRRDADVERILPKMTKILPAAALSSIADSVELDAISEALDAALLGAHAPIDNASQISETSYAAAYRAGSDPALRRRQLDLIEIIGRAMDRLTHIPMLYTTLKLMRAPARMAGLAELQGFLEAGFVTFRDMRGADEFIATIMTRERRLMEGLLAGRPDAFAGLTETG